MMRHVFGVLASVAVVATSASAAWAVCGGAPQSSAPTSGQTGATTSTEEPIAVGPEERMNEVAGVRIVPSVIAKDVTLTPSAWMLHDAQSRKASANAKVYTDQQGAITGLTITSWGLPNPERINPRFSDYVVWLVNTDTHQVLNIGTLESRNAGKAVFGYQPDAPLVGYNRIVITPEPTFATAWPSGWEQITADIPMTAMAPMENRPMQ
jgi:hypothetical protein